MFFIKNKWGGKKPRTLIKFETNPNLNPLMVADYLGTTDTDIPEQKKTASIILIAIMMTRHQSS